MAWPLDWSDGEEITAARLGQWTNAHKQWGGPVDAQGNTLSNVSALTAVGIAVSGEIDAKKLQLTSDGTPTVATLVITPPALTGPGTQFGPTSILRACSFDTVNHVRTFYHQAISLTGAGYSKFRLGTGIDAVPLTTCMEWDSDLRTYIGCPNSAPTDGNISASQITFWIDQAANNLKVRVRYSTGVYKTATIALT